MNNPTKKLTLEEYEQHKHDDKLLHEFTFAHGVQGWEPDNLALTYYDVRHDYRISPELQERAKKDYERRKQEIIMSLQKGIIAFVGMGMEFNPSTPEHIGNHRIRAYFKNDEEKVCFVEFGTNAKDKTHMRCDHALMDTRADPDHWESLAQRDATEERLSIERTTSLGAFTKDNIINLLKQHFNATYDTVKYYNYILSCDDYTSTPITTVRA